MYVSTSKIFLTQFSKIHKHLLYLFIAHLWVTNNKIYDHDWPKNWQFCNAKDVSLLPICQLHKNISGPEEVSCLLSILSQVCLSISFSQLSLLNQKEIKIIEIKIHHQIPLSVFDVGNDNICYSGSWFPLYLRISLNSTSRSHPGDCQVTCSISTILPLLKSPLIHSTVLWQYIFCCNMHILVHGG